MRLLTFIKIRERDFNEAVSMSLYEAIEEGKIKVSKNSLKNEPALEYQFNGTRQDVAFIIDKLIDEKIEFEVSEFGDGEPTFTLGYLNNGSITLEVQNKSVTQPALKIVNGETIKQILMKLESSDKSIEAYQIFEEQIKQLI